MASKKDIKNYYKDLPEEKRTYAEYISTYITGKGYLIFRLQVYILNKRFFSQKNCKAFAYVLKVS